MKKLSRVLLICTLHAYAHEDPNEDYPLKRFWQRSEALRNAEVSAPSDDAPEIDPNEAAFRALEEAGEEFDFTQQYAEVRPMPPPLPPKPKLVTPKYAKAERPAQLKVFIPRDGDTDDEYTEIPDLERSVHSQSLNPFDPPLIDSEDEEYAQALRKTLIISRHETYGTVAKPASPSEQWYNSFADADLNQWPQESTHAHIPPSADAPLELWRDMPPKTKPVTPKYSKAESPEERISELDSIMAELSMGGSSAEAAPSAPPPSLPLSRSAIKWSAPVRRKPLQIVRAPEKK